MAQSEARGSAERPLQGAVLCFTSIGPEERTRYADLALQMGAEHKLDLTSDTTHLIVGSTDTAKYQYVAREREDIKVLRPEWIEAVRECWINDLPLNLGSLAQEYRMPTLAGLKICITGFDDLSFRAQLQRNVLENGGEYTGDLTKDVTHLIAAKPEGKKYEYGLQWQKKVVSLKWYKDTLERGMQLDESLYNPTLPVEAQGIGAWNRGVQRSPRPAKRVREESSVPEPARKLRRTASARLGSQTQNLWTDIVGGAGFDAEPVDRPQLKTSVSMPSLRQSETSMKQSEKSRAECHGAAGCSESHRSISEFLTGHNFIVEGFDQRQEKIVRNIILDNGGTIAPREQCQDPISAKYTLLVAPHDGGKKRNPEPTTITPALEAVSELWLERCLFDKAFVDPEKYPLGKVKKNRHGQFSNLVVNATGFDGLETKHISQMVKLLGGKYTEKFTAGVSVLVCKMGSYNKEKLGMARRDDIPVVSEEWLWSSIRDDKKATMENFLLHQDPVRITNDKETGRVKSRVENYVEVSTIPLKPEDRGGASRPRKQPQLGRIETKKTSIRTAGRVEVHQDAMDESRDQVNLGRRSVDDMNSASERSETQTASPREQNSTLQELSSNSSGKNRPLTEAKKSTMPLLDGHSSFHENNGAENDHTTARSAPAQQSSDKSGSIHALNGAIRDFLDQEIRKKPATGGSVNEPRKTGRLMGRALSNLSNASATSRQSRASSIDSINTDGIGSEIINPPSARPSGEVGSATEKSTFSFAGRAKATLAGLKPQSLAMDDLEAPQHNGQPEEETPPLTQLGYEDPEEAILLREKLAASRRKKSKLGQEEEDPKPGVRRMKMDRKIRDDDVLTGAAWGSGRRTRHRQKSPPG